MIWLRILSVAVAAVMLLAGPISSARAQPEITESNVQDGDVLDTPPEVFHLCFSEPVDISDQPAPDSGGDQESPWEFNVTTPDGRNLGLRIVFQPDGECVDVEPGLPQDPPDGIWLFEWFVRSQETGDEASGALTFRVGPGERPAPINSEPDDDDATIYVIGGVVGAAALAAIAAALVVVRRRQSSAKSGRS